MEVQHQPYRVNLLVGSSPGVVLVLVIDVNLRMPPDGKLATSFEGSTTPLVILRVVEDLYIGIGGGPVTADCDLPFELQPVAISPGEIAVTEVELSTVAV